MKSLRNDNFDPGMLLDCSQDDQVRMLADQFNVSPEAVKTSVRACCSNSVEHIALYLQNVYLPAQVRRLN